MKHIGEVLKDVAQVLLAEKITRILSERESAVVVPPITKPEPTKIEGKIKVITNNTNTASGISRAEQEKRELEEAKRKLEEENQKTEAARQAEAKRIEQQRRIHQTTIKTTPTGDSLKKAIGIAVAVLAVVAVVLILVLK